MILMSTLICQIQLKFLSPYFVLCLTALHSSNDKAPHEYKLYRACVYLRLKYALLQLKDPTGASE